MYEILLAVHNILRWVALGAAIFAVVWAWKGFLGKQPFSKGHRIGGIAFTASMDIQLLLGLVLYIISPMVQAALSDMGAAMADRQMRFFAVEHISMMFIAVVLAHVGSFLSKRAEDDRKKHKQGVIFYTIALVLILGAIPWWRPFFPGL